MRIAEQERKYYNKWKTYESDLECDGWQVPRLLIDNFKNFLKGGETILDIGCGTGFVGVELKRIGWRGSLIGVDISELRMREALEKDVYQACFQMDAERLGFLDKTFDVVLSSAVVGLTGPKSVLEMHRVLKIGGLIGCAAVKFRNVRGGDKRSSVSCFGRLPSTIELDRIDIGTGYSGMRNDERYILYILRLMSKKLKNT